MSKRNKKQPVKGNAYVLMHVNTHTHFIYRYLDIYIHPVYIYAS